ncbi:MAG: glycerol acyltransferase [Bacteroidaceae bacterium]|nr:glycerol acyltransferase [Bacteroidaceae bacterium]
MAQQPLDIRSIIRSKAGNKARFVPGFLIAYLERIAHQRELNEFFEQAGDLEGVPWLDAAVKFAGVTVERFGEDNLPAPDDPRRYTFVSNHPLGGIDGITLGSILGHRYDGHIRYLVNDLLMNLQGLAPLCVGVNKFGAQGHDFARKVSEAFSSDNHIIMFPADLCSRKQGGVIRDVDWKKTFIQKSVETRRDVVPIHFGGQNSDFFYNLANWSKRLGIKFNIAMLYLADETFKNRGKTFTVKFGKPIPWETFDKSRTAREWAAYVRQQVYEL